MTTKIGTVATFEEAAEVIARGWKEAGKSKILRFEGFDGVGKSGLAKLVAPRIDAIHIEGDKFAIKPDVPTPYWRCLRTGELQAAVNEAVASGRPVILDAVCLDKVAPSPRWGHGFSVYVKRLSFNNPAPFWHDWLLLEDGQETCMDEPHRGIVEYHRQFRPHQRADLIIELPNAGHKMWSSTFDRSLCFDPPGAEVLPYDGIGIELG